MVEKNALEDEGVKAEIAKLKLPEGAMICADPWIYGELISTPGPRAANIRRNSRSAGSDGINDNERLYQVFLYMRDPLNASEKDSNHYAFPLPLSPVLDCSEYKVVRIDHLPTGAGVKPSKLEPYQHKLPNEYIHEHQDLRKDLKPLHVVQPEGASFTVTPIGETGNHVSWQKWTFKVGV